MARKFNLLIDQGSDFTFTYPLKDNNGDPIDLNGFSLRSQLRKYVTSNTAVSFQTSINTTSSSITLTLSANTTANLVSDRYVYDAELYTANSVQRVLEGIITVNPRVTR